MSHLAGLIILLCSHALAFISGGLFYRNNAKKAEAALQVALAEAAAAKVALAAAKKVV